MKGRHHDGRGLLSLVVVFVVALLLTHPGVATAQAAAERVASVQPGETAVVEVRIAEPTRAGQVVKVQLLPAETVTIVGAREDTWRLPRDPATPLIVKLKLIVARRQGSGLLDAARLVLRWSDGTESTRFVRVSVLPLPPGIPAKDLEAELIPTPRTVAPGGIVKLMYAVSSYEDTDERIRIRLEAASGWHLLDTTETRTELVVEAWEQREGDLYLQAPTDARVGDRQPVRLLVEIVGEPGVVEAQNYVLVGRSGSVRPGVPTVSASATAGFSRISESADAQRATALTLSTRFAGTSTFSLTYDQGLSENLSNYRFQEQRTRATTTLRHRGWELNAGNGVFAGGHALSGPSVRIRGVSVRRSTGTFIGDVVAGQPNVIGGRAAGRTVRGRIGIHQGFTTIAVNASEFRRPVGGYTTLPTVQQTLVNADEQERIDVERRITTSASANRVFGFGIDTEIGPARGHSVLVRGGGLRLENTAGARVSAGSREASYAYTGAAASLTVRWRDTPPTLQGILLAGDERTADGWLRVGGGFRIVGRAYRSSVETVGLDLASTGQGTSGGLTFVRGRSRFDVRFNDRSSSFDRLSIRRTGSLQLTVPVGPFTLSTGADAGREASTPVGDATGQTTRASVGFYRADLRWTRLAETFSLSLSHATGHDYRRSRADVLASFDLGGFELAGGVWVTRGYIVGGRPGGWLTIGVPIGGDRLLTVGADYASPTWLDPPSVRGLVTIRQRFSFAVPFVRSASLPGG